MQMHHAGETKKSGMMKWHPSRQSESHDKYNSLAFGNHQHGPSERPKHNKQDQPPEKMKKPQRFRHTQAEHDLWKLQEEEREWKTQEEEREAQKRHYQLLRDEGELHRAKFDNRQTEKTDGERFRGMNRQTDGEKVHTGGQLKNSYFV